MTEETLKNESEETSGKKARKKSKKAEKTSKAEKAGAEKADASAKAESTDAELAEKKGYVVTTYSGYENKVKLALQERIRQFNMQERFGEILIPSETVVTGTTKDGRNKVRTKTTFPGYIFVEMLMSEEAWHVVKDTPKVTGFIGNQRPQEVKPPHIEDLRKGITEGAVKPKPKQQFNEGDEVRVVVGAFANFSGTVQEVRPDKQKLKVMVSIFGRPTPVELDFTHVEKR